MKDQLQLQEIAGYLPFRLKVLTGNNIVRELTHIYEKYSFKPKEFTSIYNIMTGLGHKLILRPMSELTRPMLEEAGFECHIDYLTNEFNHWVTTYGIDHVINMLPYGHVQWLYRNHFDIHNLIGRGLAISIHDIPTKP